MKNNKLYFEFTITKWDATGNSLVERYTMTVRRQSQISAKNVVIKKYPSREGYFIELNNKYTK